MEEAFVEEYEIDDTVNTLPSDESISQAIDATKALAIGSVIERIRAVSTTPSPYTEDAQMHEFFIKRLRTLHIDNTDLLKLSLDSETTM